MKRNSFLLILCIFLFVKAENSFASHAVGADLTYQCLGGNNYRFFFTLYRDCSGIAVNATYPIIGTSTCGGNVNITVSLDSTNEVLHTCPAIQTKCTNSASPYYGVQANYYHGDVILPSVCNHWTFGLNPVICNRNSIINNLDPNGSTYCLYVQATLDNATVQCNNSPTFANHPVAFLCANQIQYSQQNVVDPDNDSLSFEMYTPHSDAGTDVLFIPGLSGTQPVTYTTDSTQFNSSNGEIRFLADGFQVTVIGIRISDFRNGILIGSVERDMQLIFESCSSPSPNQPVGTGMNGSTDFSTHICYDSLFTFQIYTSDADSDSTLVTWNYGIPGATLTTIPGLFETGIFSWPPDSLDIGNNAHYFTVYVTDKFCSLPSMNSYTFEIFVDSCHATSGMDELENSIRYFNANYSFASHAIRFSYRLEEKCDAFISLYDITGRKIKDAFVENSLERTMDISVAGLAGGLYLLNLKTTNGLSKSIKVVID